MKRFYNHLVSTLLLAAFLCISCDRFGEDYLSETGRMNISFAEGGELLTKAYANVPDTSDFILSVTDNKGNVIYKGTYGDSPESIEVTAGTYLVRVVSSEFSKPAFDAPQFGDEQCVTVPAAGVVNVSLICSQINAGLRLDISADFLTSCPDAVLFLKSSQGKLMYSYSEKRIAYFSPGAVSLVMNTGGEDNLLMVRDLSAREVLTVGVSVSDDLHVERGGIKVSVDTSRVWLNEDIVIGKNDSGLDPDEALTVSEARSSVGAEDVWVNGYVVGGDLTSASASFNAPFESMTNILLGPRSSTSDKKVCLSVQLQAGEIRDALNLVNNPSLLGKRICIKGDIVSAYYGIPGIKNITEYKLL
jgi:hypothetical protein